MTNLYVQYEDNQARENLMDTIKCMNTFAAVATNESFTDGAKQLGISTKLASKYVQQLEERIEYELEMKV